MKKLQHPQWIDENDVREGDALCEPQMHEVTLDEARAFLSARRNQSNA